MKKESLPVPLEEDEQALLFEWAELQKGAYPELKWMYHIANGGKRHIGTAIKLKQQGVKPGVLDICLPVRRGEYGGLYIEMKRIKGGKLSPEQIAWMEHLMHEGYCVASCKGFEKAKEMLLRYLKMKKNGEGTA